MLETPQKNQTLLLCLCFADDIAHLDSKVCWLPTHYFGAWRGDLNNTSIYQPLMPANIDAPGMRLQVKPHPRWDARAYDHAAWLAPPTDSWVIAGLRDSSGQSGDFIGHTIDRYVRYWVVLG